MFFTPAGQGMAPSPLLEPKQWKVKRTPKIGFKRWETLKQPRPTPPLQQRLKVPLLEEALGSSPPSLGGEAPPTLLLTNFYVAATTAVCLLETRPSDQFSY